MNADVEVALLGTLQNEQAQTLRVRTDVKPLDDDSAKEWEVGLFR
jgi:hypothetical protein